MEPSEPSELWTREEQQDQASSSGAARRELTEVLSVSRIDVGGDMVSTAFWSFLFALIICGHKHCQGATPVNRYISGTADKMSGLATTLRLKRIYTTNILIAHCADAKSTQKCNVSLCVIREQRYLSVWPTSDSILATDLLQRSKTDSQLLCGILLREAEVLGDIGHAN